MLCTRTVLLAAGSDHTCSRPLHNRVAVNRRYVTPEVGWLVRAPASGGGQEIGHRCAVYNVLTFIIRYLLATLRRARKKPQTGARARVKDSQAVGHRKPRKRTHAPVSVEVCVRALYNVL